MTRILSLALATLAIGAGRANDHWPQFRGPNGDGHSDSNGLPLNWSETENVKWKAALHGKGWSSPVVWGNQVWLTTATEDGHELFVVCVDRDSGNILRDQKIFEVEKPQFCHAFNSYASPTPVLEEGRIYVSFGSPGIACLETKTGKVLWRSEEHTSELQSQSNLVCRLLLEKKKKHEQISTNWYNIQLQVFIELRGDH